MENYTYREISRQPESWGETVQIVSEKKDALLRLLSEFEPEEIVFTGCGSSYYLSIAAAYLFQEKIGLSAKAVPASDILLKPASVLAGNRRTLVVGSSRSGDTTELVRAMDVARKHPRSALSASPPTLTAGWRSRGKPSFCRMFRRKASS
jgi:glucosamine--fructose-6-phosphate aminotransferase (isomerizing)